MIVNMSGCAIQGTQTPEIMLPIADPMGKDDDSYRLVRDRVEQTVRFLVEHFRQARVWADPPVMDAAIPAISPPQAGEVLS